MARTTKPAQPETHERATTNTEQGLFFIILLLFILLQCLGWVSVSALQTNAPVYKMNFITLDYFICKFNFPRLHIDRFPYVRIIHVCF